MRELLIFKTQEETPELADIIRDDLKGISDTCHSIQESDLKSLLYSLEDFKSEGINISFGYPDYYSAFQGFPIKRLYSILNAYYKNLCINSKGLKRFLYKGIRLENYATEIKINELLKDEILISGYEVTNEVKLSCVEFMQDNNIPVYMYNLRVLLNRYIRTGKFYLIPMKKGDDDIWD